MSNLIDKSNMKQTIMDFPKQFIVGYNSAGDSGREFTDKNFENIIISGMGGSALPGELLKLFSQEINLNIPVFINKDYTLNNKASKNSLIIPISYSGDTEETLSAYEEARDKNFSIAIISSGGKLESLAKKNNNTLALIPSGTQPRIAIGYQFAALLKILANSGVIKPQEENLKNLASALKPAILMDDARKLAKKIKDKTPIIYSSEKYKQLAYILKIQMNENAKRHAFYNVFPELNHNEIMGYEKNSKFKIQNSKNFYIIILKSKDDHPRIIKRMELTANIIKNKGYETEFIDINSENMYTGVFNTLLLGVWLSYYLAIHDKIDPTPVDIIEEFKNSLNSSS